MPLPAIVAAPMADELLMAAAAAATRKAGGGCGGGAGGGEADRAGDAHSESTPSILSCMGGAG